MIKLSQSRTAYIFIEFLKIVINKQDNIAMERFLSFYNIRLRNYYVNKIEDNCEMLDDSKYLNPFEIMQKTTIFKDFTKIIVDLGIKQDEYYLLDYWNEFKKLMKIKADPVFPDCLLYSLSNWGLDLDSKKKIVEILQDLSIY